MTRRSRIFISLVLILPIIALAGTGVADSPKKVSLKPGQKIRVHTVGFDHFSARGFMVGIRNDTLLIGNEGRVRIDAATTIDSVTYKFPFPGARYDRDAETLSGFNSLGDSVNLALSEIDYVEATLVEQKKTFSVTFNAATLKKRLQGGDYHPQLQKIPMESVELVEIWHKKQKGPVLLIGAAMGLAVGLVVGEAAYQDSEDDFLFSPSKEACYIISGAIWTLIGVWLANLLVGDDVWEKVPLRDLNIGPMPTSEREIGISVTYSF